MNSSCLLLRSVAPCVALGFQLRQRRSWRSFVARRRRPSIAMRCWPNPCRRHGTWLIDGDPEKDPSDLAIFTYESDYPWQTVKYVKLPYSIPGGLHFSGKNVKKNLSQWWLGLGELILSFQSWSVVLFAQIGWNPKYDKLGFQSFRLTLRLTFFWLRIYWRLQSANMRDNPDLILSSSQSTPCVFYHFLSCLLSWLWVKTLR